MSAIEWVVPNHKDSKDNTHVDGRDVNYGVDEKRFKPGATKDFCARNKNWFYEELEEDKKSSIS